MSRTSATLCLEIWSNTVVPKFHLKNAVLMTWERSDFKDPARHLSTHMKTVGNNWSPSPKVTEVNRSYWNCVRHHDHVHAEYLRPKPFFCPFVEAAPAASTLEDQFSGYVWCDRRHPDVVIRNFRGNVFRHNTMCTDRHVETTTVRIPTKVVKAITTARIWEVQTLQHQIVTWNELRERIPRL